MMFNVDYYVKGEDVNDHMAMESRAYFSYSIRHVYNFLFQLGYSRQKLNKLKIHLQEQKSQFEIHKPLMFGNNFSISLSVMEHDWNKTSFNIKNHFFNSNNELCAVITSETTLNSVQGSKVLVDVTKKMVGHKRVRAYS